MCDASNPLKRAADTSGDSVDLGEAASDASSQLEGLAEAASRRLRELGAADAPPPPSPGFQRSAFARSTTSDADRADMEERLRRLRLQGTGALEGENLPAIEAAMKMAEQWTYAGLHARARKQLLEVEPFMSCKTDLGARFHLQLADATHESGETAQARRLRQRVQVEAESSALRWQAERILDASNPAKKPGSSTPSSSSSNPELSSLWKMPDWS